MYRAVTPRLAVLILLTFLYQSLPGQAPANSTLATRSLIVTVIDLHGSAVRDLTKENFAVFLNDEPAPISNVRYSLAPRRIVVLLDLSGSMVGETGSDKWRIASEAVRDLLSQTPAEVPIAVVTFASGIYEVFGFSQSRTAVANWLQANPDRPPKLKEKKTALFDAIIEGLKLLGDAQPGDAIYAITDGGENASRASATQTEAALLQSGVRLFAFLFNESVPSFVVDGRDLFPGMVQDSAGLAFKLAGHRRPGSASWTQEYAYDKDNREKVKAFTTELNIQMHEIWALELAAPVPSGKSRVRLMVTDRAGKERKDIVVAYPRVLLSAK